MSVKLQQAAFRSADGHVQGTGAVHDTDALPAGFEVKDEGFLLADGGFVTRDQATALLHVDHPVQSEELDLIKNLNDYSFDGPNLNGGLYEVKAKTKDGKLAGSLTFRANAVTDPKHPHYGYHRIDQAHVGMQHQRQGLYGRMLQLGALHVKQKLKSKGLVSEGQWRSEAATGAWERLASKGKVKQTPGVEPDAPDFRMSERPYDESDPDKQDYEFARAFGLWLARFAGKLVKSDEVLALLRGNLKSGILDADHEVACGMLGFLPDTTLEFRAARFLARSHGVDPSKIRAALIAYDHDMEMAALLAYDLPRTEANRALLRSVAKLQDLEKAEVEPVTIPRDIQPALPEADKTAASVRRAFAAHSVHNVKLNGKHSKGTLIAEDPQKRSKWLLKPGSGPDSPAAGVVEDPATQSEREVCFSHCAELLQLGDSVPHADLLLIDGQQIAALVLLGQDFKNLNESRRSTSFQLGKVLEPYRQSGVLYEWAALDFVFGNIDRHAGNVMVDADGDVKLIDHGSAFAGFAFNPALDSKSFIPCYLRAWSSENFAELTPKERLARMPHPDDTACKRFADWVDQIRVLEVKHILSKYHILVDASISRLETLKQLPPPDRLPWLLSFWAGDFGS